MFQNSFAFVAFWDNLKLNQKYRLVVLSRALKPRVPPKYSKETRKLQCWNGTRICIFPPILIQTIFLKLEQFFSTADFLFQHVLYPQASIGKRCVLQV